MAELTGRVAVVTGAGSGIGTAAGETAIFSVRDAIANINFPMLCVP